MFTNKNRLLLITALATCITTASAEELTGRLYASYTAKELASRSSVEGNNRDIAVKVDKIVMATRLWHWTETGSKGGSLPKFDPQMFTKDDLPRTVDATGNVTYIPWAQNFDHLTPAQLKYLDGHGIKRTQYDSSFISYANMVTSAYQMKAQCMAESALKPNARSKVGAVGTCQFMPKTWRDMCKYHKICGKATNSDQNIKAAYKYMGSLTKSWKRRNFSNDEAHKMALASYNAGEGTLLKAWKRCKRARGERCSRKFDVIKMYLGTSPSNRRQTKDYVDKITKMQRMLKPKS